MKHFILLSWLLVSFLIMRNESFAASSYVEQEGVKLYSASLETVQSSSRTVGDATFVLSTETASQWLRPSGETTVLKLAVTVAGTVASTYIIDFSVNVPASSLTSLSYPFYFSPSSITSYAYSLFVADQAGFANYWTFGPMTVAPNSAEQGWNLVTLKTDIPASTAGTMTGAVIGRIRHSIVVPAGQTPTFYIGAMIANKRMKPVVTLSFDDSLISHYTEALPYMRNRGLVGTESVLSTSSGLTVTQLLELQTSGWAMANHSNSNTDYTTLTQAQILANLEACNLFMTQTKLSYGAKQIVYPGGGRDSDSDAAMSQFSALYGWTVRQQIEKYWDGVQDRLSIDRISVNASSTLSTLTAYVEQAIQFGGMANFILHNIVPNAVAGDVDLQTFKNFIDYLTQQKNRGVIDVVNLQEFTDKLYLSDRQAEENKRLTQIR